MERLKLPKDDAKVHHEPSKTNRFVDADTILFFFGQLKAKGEAKKLAAKAEASVRKQFKNTGISLNVFDTVVRLSEQEDADAVQQFLDEFVHIAAAFTLPVGTQMTLFDGPASVVDAKERARLLGYNRGVAGHFPDEQAYPPTSDLGQAHLEGWEAGQKIHHERFIAYNEQAAREEAERKAKAEAKAAAKAEREAKKEAGAVRQVEPPPE